VSVQLISLSERLEEAEGGAESQVIYHILLQQNTYNFLTIIILYACE